MRVGAAAVARLGGLAQRRLPHWPPTWSWYGDWVTRPTRCCSTSVLGWRAFRAQRHQHPIRSLWLSTRTWDSGSGSNPCSQHALVLAVTCRGYGDETWSEATHVMDDGW